MDRYLPSSHELDNGLHALQAREQPLRTFLKSQNAESIRIELRSIGQNKGYDEGIDQSLGWIREASPVIEPDLRAYRDQITNNASLWSITKTASAADDIGLAIDKAETLLYHAGTQNLEGKSLQQLVAKAIEAESIVARKKAQEEAARLSEQKTIEDFTKTRSVELNKSQNLLPGFVELTTPQDFAADTYFLNNCVGASGMSVDGKYKPAFHPVTGQQIASEKDLQSSSFQQYQNLLKDGNSRFFSYRPEGLPQLTIEVEPLNGAIKQVTGLDNRSPTWKERYIVEDMVKKVFPEPYRPSNISWGDQI